jgi:hypothetical protein
MPYECGSHPEAFTRTSLLDAERKCPWKTASTLQASGEPSDEVPSGHTLHPDSPSCPGQIRVSNWRISDSGMSEALDSICPRQLDANTKTMHHLNRATTQ